MLFTSATAPFIFTESNAGTRTPTSAPADNFARFVEALEAFSMSGKLVAGDFNGRFGWLISGGMEVKKRLAAKKI